MSATFSLNLFIAALLVFLDWIQGSVAIDCRFESRFGRIIVVSCPYGCCGSIYQQRCCQMKESVSETLFVVGCVVGSIGITTLIISVFICLCCRNRNPPMPGRVISTAPNVTCVTHTTDASGANRGQEMPLPVLQTSTSTSGDNVSVNKSHAAGYDNLAYT